jgi:DNA-binding CsgD family transcriptional regulator
VVKLSPRQKQVLTLLAGGRTEDEIGERLGISPRTARAHVDALKRKLGVSRRREIPSAFHRLTGQDPFDTETY